MPSTQTVTAALLTKPGEKFRITQLELQDPQVGEVLVKIQACGVCHSDYHLVTGATKHPLPCVAGHEGAGIVAGVGPGVTNVKIGDAVVLSWAPDCGDCFFCLAGKPNLCNTFTDPLWAGTMLDGTTRLALGGQPVYHYCGLAAFADHVVVPMQSCIPIPNGIPPAAAALVGCAVATGVGAALYTARIQAGDAAVILGIGGVGLNILQGCQLAGATTMIAVDQNPEKAGLAAQFGATHFLTPGPTIDRQIAALTQKRGADWVFEAVGKPEVQEAGMNYLRPGGTLVLVGLAPMGSATNFPSAVIARKEITIKGSYYGTVSPRRDFPRLLEWYQAGKIKLDELIDRHYRLAEINQAFTQMIEHRAARGVIVFD